MGLGLLVKAGESMIDISERMDQAHRDLAQAVDAHNAASKTDKTTIQEQQAALDDFIGSNRAYITDQSEVVEGYASLLRAGLSTTEAQLDLNRALDIASLKHISLTDAIALVNNAEHGRVRGLVDLGITSAKYVDSAGNVVDANHNMAKVMDELDQKTKDGRKSTTDLQQSQNNLSNDWQDVSNRIGPALVGAIDDVIGMLDLYFKFLGQMPYALAVDWTYFIAWLRQGISEYNAIAAQVGLPQVGLPDLPGLSRPGDAPSTATGNKAGAQSFDSGGTVTGDYPGQRVMVQAKVGEHFSMGGKSSGGGQPVTVNVYGYVGNNRQLALVIRDELRRLDREQR